MFANRIFDGYAEKEYDVPLEDGIKSGSGSQKFEKDGKIYTLECTWVNGKKNGEGIFLDPDSIMAMKLVFKDDVIEGEGSLYENGQVTFKGMWKGGVRCGHGVEYKKGHVLYDGEFENDLRHGFGIEYGEDNMVEFEGEWKEGKRGTKYICVNKKGKKELTETTEDDKLIYVGGYKEGTMLRDGQGVEFDENEKPKSISIFENGALVRRVKEFKGKEIVLYDENGKKLYEGGFKNSRELGYPADGKGKQYENGIMVYNGDFVKGKRDGHGFSYYLNRTLKYDGDWKDNKANGNGKFYNEEGILEAEGEFVDDMFRDSEKVCHVDSGEIELLKNKRGCFC